MLSKSISRRLMLKLMIGSAIGLVVSDAISAGDFRYEQRSEKNWPRNIVRAIQNRLNEIGIDSGQADGIYGPKTKRAIMEFQSSKNMKVDGKISNELIGELKLE